MDSLKYTLWKDRAPAAPCLDNHLRELPQFKIFPLFFQLAGYQFFWGTWRRKSSPVLSRLLPRMTPACEGASWHSVESVTPCSKFLNSLLKSWASQRYRFILPPVSFHLWYPSENLYPTFPVFKIYPVRHLPPFSMLYDENKGYYLFSSSMSGWGWATYKRCVNIPI